LVTPGRWLSIEVKRLARDRRAAGEDIGRARADLERALAARRYVDELGGQTVSTASTRAARMLRPGPAVPIERPLTVEESSTSSASA
jgi:hypothetical protein